MNAFTDHDLIRYVLGHAPPSVAQAVAERAGRDDELASKLAMMRHAFGPQVADAVDDNHATTSQPVLPNFATRKRWSLRRPLRLAASIALILAMSSLAYAGYAWWTAPLFSDHFKTGWFDSRKWRVPPEIVKEGGVFAEKGHIRLINRGYLVTNQEFKEPIEVSLEWKWSQLGLLPQYADHLTVVLRTTGTATQHMSYEVQDGVLVRFNASDGTLSIWTTNEQDSQPVVPEGGLPLPAEQWHTIRITDDGTNIAVFVSGPAILPETSLKPIAKKSVPYRGLANHVAVYNREFLAKIPHESSIRAFAIRPLK